jgi:hypothetical protein
MGAESQNPNAGSGSPGSPTPVPGGGLQRCCASRSATAVGAGECCGSRQNHDWSRRTMSAEPWFENTVPDPQGQVVLPGFVV